MNENNGNLRFSFYKRNVFSGLIFIILLINSGCGSSTPEDEGNQDFDKEQEESAAKIDSLQDAAMQSLPQVEIPEGYEIISEDEGDLDGDGVDEKVIVFDTNREMAQGHERELRIYIDQDGVWSLSHTAIGPVLGSEAGGTMGDAFEKMTVTGGGIIIDHFGGSVERWSYTHEFRLVEDEWKLSIATLVFFTNCNFTETYTYNLQKGTGYHSRQKESCDDNGNVIRSKFEVEESITIKKPNVLMDGFRPGSTEINVVGEEDAYYL